MPLTFDAIIIGAGIMGCSTAYQLARRGLKVAVVEKTHIGAGSTGRSSAIIRQHYSNEFTARMALYSLRIFQNFDDAVGGESGFTTTGFLVLVPERDLEGLKANVAMQQKVGIRTEIIGPEAALEYMPGLEVGDIVAAAWEPEAGYADPNLTVNSFANAARRHKARIFQDEPVTGVTLGEDGIVRLESKRERWEAPIVINTAGPWAARVAQMVGVEVPINPCRVQVAFFRRPPGYEAPHPVVADFINATYFRDETGGQTLVGLIDPSEADNVVDPDNYKEQVDTEFVLDVGEKLVRRYPIIETSEATGGYAALYAITPDWHPIVDELVPSSGFYICAGFSGHGFKLGPAVGVMVADMVLKESEPEFDHRFFRLRRYEENAPVRGAYEYSIAG